ncbi:hypothetical protein, partial [Alteromonas sp. a30]|uniref:hypothetical protein n=1 Tax=Alteromonas sp. a30 TaxID=2730917 RepID=UPI00227F7BA6
MNGDLSSTVGGQLEIRAPRMEGQLPTVVHARYVGGALLNKRFELFLLSMIRSPNHYFSFLMS